MKTKNTHSVSCGCNLNEFYRLLDDGHIEKALYMIEVGLVDINQASAVMADFLNRKDSIILTVYDSIVKWFKRNG
jgi:hypothetical protein